MIQETHVLVFPWRFPDPLPNEVILIEKLRPSWMKGMLNLPGGAIEEGETALDAACRELTEETGITAMDAFEIGRVPGVMNVVVCKYMGQQARQIEDEPLHILSLREALAHRNLMGNLRVIIPLVVSKVSGWELSSGEGAALPGGLFRGQISI